MIGSISPKRCALVPKAGQLRLAARAHQRSISTRSKNTDVVDEAEAEPEQEGRGNNKLTLGSLIELIGFGLGAPVPSSIEFDREKKVVRMDFEANNFDQKYAYFDEGYVDEDADVMKKLGNFFKFGKKKDEEEK